MTTVEVRDLGTGEQTALPQETPTIDVPGDFPRTGGAFAVADGFRASYTDASGKAVARTVAPRPLGWRAKGETCLIARTGGARTLRHYRLCAVVP